MRDIPPPQPTSLRHPFSEIYIILLYIFVIKVSIILPNKRWVYTYVISSNIQSKQCHGRYSFRLTHRIRKQVIRPLKK